MGSTLERGLVRVSHLGRLLRSGVVRGFTPFPPSQQPSSYQIHNNNKKPYKGVPGGEPGPHGIETQTSIMHRATGRLLGSRVDDASAEGRLLHCGWRVARGKPARASLAQPASCDHGMRGPHTLIRFNSYDAQRVPGSRVNDSNFTRPDPQAADPTFEKIKIKIKKQLPGGGSVAPPPPETPEHTSAKRGTEGNHSRGRISKLDPGPVVRLVVAA